MATPMKAAPFNSGMLFCAPIHSCSFEKISSFSSSFHVDNLLCLLLKACELQQQRQLPKTLTVHTVASLETVSWCRYGCMSSSTKRHSRIRRKRLCPSQKWWLYAMVTLLSIDYTHYKRVEREPYCESYSFSFSIWDWRRSILKKCFSRPRDTIRIQITSGLYTLRYG